MKCVEVGPATCQHCAICLVPPLGPTFFVIRPASQLQGRLKIVKDAG